MSEAHGSPWVLTNVEGFIYGQIVSQNLKERLLQGTFVPAADFASVSDLFRAFEEAVDQQALRAVESLDAAIGLLGLAISLPDGQRIFVKDVQIYSDGAMSCRLLQPVPTALNGTAKIDTSAPSFAD